MHPMQAPQVQLPSSTAASCSRPSFKIFWDQEFHQHKIMPTAAELAVLLVHSDFLPTGQLAEFTRSFIGRDDAADQFVESIVARGGLHRFHQILCNTVTPQAAFNIDGKLSDAVITAPRAVGAQCRPAHDRVFYFSNENG